MQLSKCHSIMDFEYASVCEAVTGFTMELLGTAMLLFLATGPLGLDILGTSAAFGTAITVALFATNCSHLNPAVTIAFLLAQYTGPLKAMLNIFAQLTGAMLGSCFVYILHGKSTGSNYVPGNTDKAFVAELLGTMILVYVILQTRKQIMAPLAIGATVFAAHLVLIPLSSASLNPARTIGPGVFVDTWQGSSWVFFVGPSLGAALAVPLHVLTSDRLLEISNFITSANE